MRRGLALNNPRSLGKKPFGASRNIADGESLLSRSVSQDLAEKAMGLCSFPDSAVFVLSAAVGRTTYSRNRLTETIEDDARRVVIVTGNGINSAAVTTHQLDDEGLKAAVTKAEKLVKDTAVADEEKPYLPSGQSNENALLWSASVLTVLGADVRNNIIDTVIADIERAGHIGAVFLEASALTEAVLTKSGSFNYARASTCVCNVNVHTADGTGSGWSGWIGEDWSKADPSALAIEAISLAERSKNPVAIEPGRYTVIMSPTAAGNVCLPIAQYALSGEDAEVGLSPFSRPGGGTKIGQKVFDERVTMTADPANPLGGFLPFTYDDGEFEQFSKIGWVENGILKNLAYDPEAAKQYGKTICQNSEALFMAGGETSLDDMIRSTKRGVYVTRFWNVYPVTRRTMLLTGSTRDGTFLIENGKLTRPIKNFRFEDSPFFFLNNLEALGTPLRVLAGGETAIFPPLMVRDFTFTSVSDSV